MGASVAEFGCVDMVRVNRYGAREDYATTPGVEPGYMRGLTNGYWPSRRQKNQAKRPIHAYFAELGGQCRRNDSC